MRTQTKYLKKIVSVSSDEDSAQGSHPIRGRISVTTESPKRKNTLNLSSQAYSKWHLSGMAGLMSALTRERIDLTDIKQGQRLKKKKKNVTRKAFVALVHQWVLSALHPVAGLWFVVPQIAVGKFSPLLTWSNPQALLFLMHSDPGN